MTQNPYLVSNNRNVKEKIVILLAGKYPFSLSAFAVGVHWRFKSVMWLFFHFGGNSWHLWNCYLFFAFLSPLGSPGPPENVKVDEITDTTAQLSWKEGTDNHSPVISYSVQARTPFSVGWQTATTGKWREANAAGSINGFQVSAKTCRLSPLWYIPL